MAWHFNFILNKKKGRVLKFYQTNSLLCDYLSNRIGIITKLINENV